MKQNSDKTYKSKSLKKIVMVSYLIKTNTQVIFFNKKANLQKLYWSTQKNFDLISTFEVSDFEYKKFFYRNYIKSFKFYFNELPNYCHDVKIIYLFIYLTIIVL